jgi:hypothetical protein
MPHPEITLENIQINDAQIDPFLSTLERIEQLLQINTLENSTFTDIRMHVVYQKLCQYISHTQSMLHECMLTLAETVMEAEAEAEAQAQEEDEDTEKPEFDELDEDNFSNPTMSD